MEKEQALSDMSARRTEQEQIIKDLSSHLEAKEQSLLELKLELEKKDRAIEELSSCLSEAEQNVASLSSQLTLKERSCEFLSEQLSAKDYELRKMSGSLGWGLLKRYGRIKYRYLLPLYRLLGLPPFERNATGGIQTNPAPEKGQEALQPVIAPGRINDQQTATAVVTLHELPYAADESNAYDVVCFPIIDWDFRFQRPQQLMSRFAAAGHRVFYIRHTFHLSGRSYTIKQKRKNIFEISLRGPQRNVYTDVLDEKAVDALLASLDALRRDLLLGATVSFVQLPFWARLANKARVQFAWPLIYDCMDYHAGFSTNKRQMIDQEHDLLSSADLVIASSEFLEKQARQHNSNVLLVRNGCEFEHFARAHETKNQRPVIGYYGAIADWFDSDLVAGLAKKRPDWDFFLVGSTFSADTSRLSKLQNVSLLGEKHYSEIPDWLGKFDVAIIPFKRNALTEATNPVKAYEILASGKPLVSVPIPEMASLAPLVRLASNLEQFETEITAALNEDSAKFAEERRAFAKAHTWEKRFEALTPAVRNAFQKASIIIVTFNNLALNRLCLESLYARTDWPNFEVIVLDNGSSDSTPEYLKEAEKTFPNLRVILSDANLGFARANNIGLGQASGDYLVLLNNDTVLTRGWLSALIRHLHADPKIGLIGPVTNQIGNEAKIPVGYTRLEDIPPWAANYVRENDNQLFEIPMLAMFCVAMRRETIERVGLLDESFEVGMFEDDDYARRIQQLGYKLVCSRDSFVHHAGRASFKLLEEGRYLEIFQKNRRTYEQKWGLWKPHLDERTKKQIPGLHKQLADIVKHSGVAGDRVAVFLPSIGWNTPLMQRPQHIARELARQGFLVFFDCSGSIIDHFSGFSRVEGNLWLYKGPVGVLETLDNPIVWSLPYNATRADHWRKARVVYDLIDDLSVFPYKQSELQKNHKTMLEGADLVLCVAKNLIDQVKDSRPDAVYAPNAVEYGLFSSSTSNNLPELDARFRQVIVNGRPIAGYYGALASWLDVDLLAEVARQRPDWNFVLIGQRLENASSLKLLEENQNVLVLRHQPYKMLPDYLAHFTTAMIPFKIDRATSATSPIKLYEYFAAAKPVITTPMPECQAFEEVLVVRNAEEFSRALNRSNELSRDSRYQQQARSIAARNSWAARVQMVVEELSKRPERNNASENRTEGEPSENAADYSNVVDEASELADRFRRFRTNKNKLFFEALADHFAPLANDSRLSFLFEDAITSNERGRVLSGLVQKYVDPRGKCYLDVGCAYGGCLVAFADRGAIVAGVDIEEPFLHLAEFNMMDNGIAATLLTGDVTRASDLIGFRDSFDIITCNDVIEHVEDPQALLQNISSMLRNNGIVYFEIPNGYSPRLILQDLDYQLFGITLLDYHDAAQYYSLHTPDTTYAGRHYLEISEYVRMFANAGLQLNVLPESFEGISVDSILNDVAALRAYAAAGLSKVPAPLRERVSERLFKYLQEVESALRATDSQQRDIKLRYGMSFWRVLGYKNALQSEQVTRSRLAMASPPTKSHSSGCPATHQAGEASRAPGVQVQAEISKHAGLFAGMSYHVGKCNVCGSDTAFFFESKASYRESLNCGECLTTSRYRSITRGILRGISELTGVEAESLADLNSEIGDVSLRIYDTQVAFSYGVDSYPIPELLSKCRWINVQTSVYRPNKTLGVKLGDNTTNQNLEKLTFPDNSFDIVITSDVMEHVRLDYKAHQEIKRSLKPGGIYLFTVPHLRDRRETVTRVAVVDPSDASKDLFLMEREYHGDANSGDDRALSYRAYGTDLDETLNALGFKVDYCKEDFPESGIMDTELFYCRLTK